MVDVEDIDGLESLLFQGGDGLGVQLIAGLGVDLARGGIHLIAREITPHERLGGEQQRLQPIVRQAFGLTGGDLGPGGRHFFARIGVDQGEFRLHAAPALGLVGGGPAAGLAHAVALFEGNNIVEGGENLFPVHAQGI